MTRFEVIIGKTPLAFDMLPKSSMKNTLALLMAVIGLAFSQVQAAQINGTIRFVGGVHFDNNHLSQATTVEQWFDVNLNSGHSNVLNSTGDFDAFVVPGQQADMFNGWVFNPSTATPGLWSVGGFTFDLASANIVSQSNFFLNILGTGTITGNGFDATPASFSFTVDNSNGRQRIIFGFAAENATTPDGGSTVMLLGFGLTALGVARRFMIG